MAYNPLDTFSQNIATLGQVFGLPELNISEKIYKPATGTQTVPYVYGSAGGAYVDPQDPNSSTSPWTNPPTTTPVTPTGGGGDSKLQQLAKTNRNPKEEAEYQALLQQAQQSSGPSEADLNSIYQPGMDYLNSLEQNYRNEQPGAESKIATGYNDALNTLQNNLSTQESSLSKQEGKVTASKQSALAEARQLYNELAQKYGALFGSRSSAGPFATELLGRETQKQFGNIQTGAQSAYNDINTERQRLTDYTNQQRVMLDQKKNDAIFELQKAFTNGLSQIQSQRAVLEQQKASQRYDLLVQAREQAQQISAAEKAYQQQIDAFYTQQQAQLGQMATAQQVQGFTPTAFQPSQINTTPTQSTTAYNFLPNKTYKDPTTGITYRQDPSTGQWVPAS